MKRSATEAKLVAAIQQEFTNADGSLSDATQANRAEALLYYTGQPRGDEVDNRSSVISMDLASSVTATLALMRQMVITDAAVTVEATGSDDEALAKAEGDITSDVIYKENYGSQKILESIKDGLISRQAVMAVDVDTDAEDRSKITIRSVPSEMISYQAGYGGDLQDIRFFAEEVPYSRSDLIEMGVSKSKVAKLAVYSTPLNQVNRVRNLDAKNGSTVLTAPTKDGDIIRCFWVYQLIDLDGDGVASRQRILYSNECILSHEPFDMVPYCIGSPFVTPHRLTGESLFDRLKHIQDTNTALQRQLLDNVALANNFRVIYDPARVDEADVMNPIAGGGIRARDPQSSVVQMVANDVSGGILQGLEYMKRKRSEISGSALDMASAEGQMINKSATAASIDKSNSELVTTLIATNFAETLIAQLFKLVHEYLRRFSNHTYTARVAGQSVEVDPLAWSLDRRFIVKAGKSPSEKQQEAMALNNDLQMQVQLMMNGFGGILADANTVHRTRQDVLRLNGVQDAETYAIDPASQQAQQAAQMQQQQQAQMQQMQAQMQKIQLELEQAKIAEDGRQHDGELQFKYYDSDLGAEVDMAKVTADGTIQLEAQEREHAAKREGTHGPTGEDIQ